MFARPEGLMVAALAAGAITLVAAAVIGGRTAEGSIDDVGPAAIGTEEGPVTEPARRSSPKPRPIRRPRSPDRRPAVPDRPRPPAPKAGAKVADAEDRRAEVDAGRDARRRVHADHFEFGVHAPITFDGAPLQPRRGPDHRVQGLRHLRQPPRRDQRPEGPPVSSRTTATRRPAAGRSPTSSRRRSSRSSSTGTLGIDQIHKVALGAKAARIPYFAGGGPEPEFKDIGMYQIISNYDQYLTWSSPSSSASTGSSTSAAPSPARDDHAELGEHPSRREALRREAHEAQMRRDPVDGKARGTINKPTEQSTYSAQMLDLRGAYNNQGANLSFPLQDPISTSRQVARVVRRRATGRSGRSRTSPTTPTRPSTLFQGQWTGMRVMSGGCYYHPQGGGKPYDPKLCAQDRRGAQAVGQARQRDLRRERRRVIRREEQLQLQRGELDSRRAAAAPPATSSSTSGTAR